MTLHHADQSRDEAVAARKERKACALEQPGGDLAVAGMQADEAHSCERSECGKQVWRTGSGLDGDGKVCSRLDDVKRAR